MALTFSCLLVILLIVGAYEVRQASAADQLLQTLNLPNCDSLPLRSACAERKFRTYDGTCNNLCNTTRGAANRPLRRLLPNAYQQPDNQPRSESVITGKSLSNCRTISRAVFTVNNTANINGTAPDFTHLTMTYGQFLDHDITLTKLTQGVECGINNEPCPQNPDCINIDIPVGEELQFNQTAKCIPLPRSFRDEDGEQVSELNLRLSCRNLCHQYLNRKKMCFLKTKNSIFQKTFGGINWITKKESCL